MSKRPKVQSERLAVLEAEVDDIKSTQKQILDKQDEILVELARYRGAFGMATLLVTAIATALMFFKDAILAKLGMKD